MISVSGLTKLYGPKVAIKNVCFTIKRGEVVGVIGPNGAGKSTLLSMLAGASRPSSGDIQVSGFDALLEPKRLQKIIGYHPQHNPVDTALTVSEYLSFIAGVRSLSKQESAIQRVLKLCQLEPFKHDRIGNLSLGFQNRVGLAQAIIHQPSLIILDEFAQGIDLDKFGNCREFITSLQATAIISSHDLHQIEDLCDRIIIMSNGDMIANDTPAQLRDAVAYHHRIQAETTLKQDQIDASVRQLNGKVVGYQIKSDGFISFDIEANDDIRDHIYDAVITNNGRIRELTIKQTSFKEVVDRISES